MNEEKKGVDVGKSDKASGNRGLSPVVVPGRSPVVAMSPARVIAQLVVAAVVGLLAADFASWIFANIYAYVHGVKLSDLSEDFAMGFYAVVVAVAAFVLTVPLTFFLLTKIFRTSQKG